MAKFFKYFPKTPYTLSPDNIDYLTNITSKVSFEKEFRDNSVVYYEYLISDGETPDIIAHKIYGSSERHWIILLLNEILNPQFDWPLSDSSLKKYIDVKYQSEQYANNSTEGAGTNWAQTNIKTYLRVETKTNTKLNEVLSIEKTSLTQNAYANLTSSSSNYTLQDGTELTIDITKESLSYYNYEVEENENKRSIKILKPEFVPIVENEFTEVFNS
jgi:hypothetical protein